MSQELFTAKEFCGITFESTSHTLKAEKVLQEEGIDLIVIPTPREISISCGLTIKIFIKDLPRTIDILRAHQVSEAGIYSIKKEGKSNLVKVLSYQDH